MSNNENTEVDVNVLVAMYSNRIAQLTNQNVVLEAKLATLTQDFEQEKEQLLMRLMEAKGTPTAPTPKAKQRKTEFQESGVD